MRDYVNIKTVTPSTIVETLAALKDFKKVIISYHRSSRSPFLSADFSKDDIKLIQAIARKHELVLDIFVNPYSLIDLEIFLP